MDVLKGAEAVFAIGRAADLVVATDGTSARVLFTIAHIDLTDHGQSS